MTTIYERIDAARDDAQGRGYVPTGIFLTSADIGELIEAIDAGDVPVGEDGRYDGLLVHEIDGGDSYIEFQNPKTSRPGKLMLHYAGHPAFRMKAG